MNDRITQSLTRLFEEKRIVFWYDTEKAMREDFDALALPDVEKLEIANNEFGLKYRILRQERDRKFLLYHSGPRPADAKNWLLDVFLASGEFRSDQVAMWLSELGLDLGFSSALRDHAEFFRAKGRMDALKKVCRPTDTPQQLRLRMLAVCTSVNGGLDTVLESLLGDLALGKDEALKLIERCGLSDFLWKSVADNYGYKADAPGLDDFAIALFKACHALSLSEDAALNAEALVLLRRWKNDRIGAKNFEILSKRLAEPLAIKADLSARDFRQLMDVDIFEEVDREIIRKIVQGLGDQTLTPGEVMRWVKQRESSHWYATFENIYLAIRLASEFMQGLSEATLGMTSLQEGFQRYAASWYRLDQLYRRFIHHYQKSGQAGLLGHLFERVENLYVNNYLVKLNDAWQAQINHASSWDIPGADRQIDFYRNQVLPFRRKDQKVCVIISDAMRYEIADELLSRIRSEDRFEGELTPMMGVLPSYTQLGMAALLPHRALRIAEDDTATVFDDQQSTVGSINREKLLASGREGDRVLVLAAEDLKNKRSDEAKEIFRDHDVIYVYHNQIDAIGDKKATEHLVADAVEDALAALIVLIKKLTSANATNILVTADHGFLYQHRELEESDFSVADVQAQTLVRNRRFVLGHTLPATPGMKRFTSAELGLSGALDVLLPNSINRLRLKGAGSRFVHGGASLQEIVVPVLRVGKSRESDIGKVDVQIISNGKTLISSGQIAILFYQSQPVSEKLHARTLRAGLYAADGELISDTHDINFAFEAENPREREVNRKFVLSRKADQYNNQDVFLRLEERVGKTNHYQEHASQRFQLRRGIVSDFDF